MRGMAIGVMMALACAPACAGDDDVEQDTASYRAVWLATALDRISILRADEVADTCAMVRLVSPGGAGGGIVIAAPEDWAVEMAGISRGSANCFSDTFVAPDVAGTGGAGSVSFSIAPGEYAPTSLSIDAAISFDTADAPAWVPEQVELTATDVPVE